MITCLNCFYKNNPDDCETCLYCKCVISGENRTDIIKTLKKYFKKHYKDDTLTAYKVKGSDYIFVSGTLNLPQDPIDLRSVYKDLKMHVCFTEVTQTGVFKMWFVEN